MKKISEYRVVQGDKAHFFSEDINSLIEQGFQPYDQLVVIYSEGKERYYQAMVKFKEIDTNH